MTGGLEELVDAMNPVARGGDTTEIDAAGKITVLEHLTWLERTSLTMAEANHVWQERLCPLHSACDHEICKSIRWKLDAVRLGYFLT